MPQASSKNIDESALTKGQLRKLNALRKSVGQHIASGHSPSGCPSEQL